MSSSTSNTGSSTKAASPLEANEAKEHVVEHDFSFLLEEPGKKMYCCEGKKKVVTKKKRKYNKEKAAATRARNKRLRAEGKEIPPSYQRKTTRPYRQTGKYRGARVMYGGKVRTFKKSGLQHLNSVHSKFMSTGGEPLSFHVKKNTPSK